MLPPAGEGGGLRTWLSLCALFCTLFGLGFSGGYTLRAHLTTAHNNGVHQDTLGPSRRTFVTLGADPRQPPPAAQQLRGDSIHAVHTSSGSDYQNYQSRLMHASWKLVQRDPGGDRLTGFTRILHRSLDDYLMEEIPTFRTHPHNPACDGYCLYPVANRPHAIKAFFDAAAANPRMIQGAWVLMLEADYVWMKPMDVPGSAWEPRTPGVQYLFDYIQPWHPNAVPWIKKLYPGPVKDVPASGPAPVLLRLNDWQRVVPDYVRLSVRMEQDEAMAKALGWMREMYAWDAAVALHRGAVHMRTESWPNSTTIVQPPFDLSLGQACLTHFTWGPIYHEGPPSRGGKQVYRWDKRDFVSLGDALKVRNVAMPPPFREGLFVTYDVPLTRAKHNLVELMVKQINRAVDTLPDLTEHYRKVMPRNQAAHLRQLRAQKAQPQAAAGRLASARIPFANGAPAAPA